MAESNLHTLEQIMANKIKGIGYQSFHREVSMNEHTYEHLNATPKLGSRVFVDSTAFLIGDIEIGDDCSVWPMTVIRGDVNRIRVGQRTSIQDGSVLHITHKSEQNPDGHPLIIGSDVTIGHKAVLHGCTVHDRCLIGIGAIILDGAVIEEEVIVGAGFLVPPGKRLKSGYVYKGNPAQAARPLTDKERDFFLYSSSNYVKLKDDYLEL